MAEPWESWPVAEEAQGEEWQNWPVVEDDSGPMGFLNRPIMGMFEGMSDIARAPARMFANEPAQKALDVGPTDVARRAGVEVARPGEQPGGYLESAAEGAGLAAATLIPGGVGTGIAARAPGVVGGAARSMAEPFLRSPVSTTAAEIGFGASAGAGGQAAEEQGLPRWAGEMVGGAAPLAPFGAARLADKALSSTGAWSVPVGVATLGTVPAAGILWRWGKRNLAGMTRAGGSQRAHERLREISGRHEQDIEALNEPNEFGLTPAQQTGNPRLMRLEQTVRGTEPEFDVAVGEGLDATDERLAQALRDMAEGAQAQDAVQYIRGVRAVAEDTLRREVETAERNVMDRLARLSPEMRETEASSIVREELDKALKSARAKESQLWNEVPQDVTVPTQNAKEAFQTFRSQLGRAQYDDLPDEAVRFLDPDKSNTAFKGEESVKEVHALYSKLRETARKARAAGEPNKARIADGIAEAVLRDIESADAASAPMEAARAFSRELNKKFRQGKVGDILGFEREGGVSTPSEMTLAQTLGQGGARGAVTADELRAAIGDSPNAERAMRDYMRRRFTEFAAPRGEFRPERAQDFLRQNNELLDRFPDLKREIQEAAESGQFAGEARRTVDEGLKEAAQTPAAKFAEAPFGREFETILSQPNAPQAARALVREARNDPSGKALAGLKDAALDYLMKHRGDMSLKSLRNALEDKKTGGAIREILSPDELRRLGRIVGTLERTKMAREASVQPDGIISDTPSTILRMIAGVAGAQVGRRVAASTGGGTVQTPGIFAGRFREALARITTDQAERLLRDAVKDPDLMKSLLISPNIPAKRAPGRLKAWLAAETGMQFNEEGGQAPDAQANVVEPQASARTQTFRPSPENPNKVYSMLTEKGIPPHVAAGLVGNIMVESGAEINPLAVGDNGQSGGALQLKGPRWQSFIQWAREQDRDPRALETQVDYMLHELRTSERKAAEKIWSAKTPAEAARRAARFYWRPSKPHMDRRVKHARQFAQ